MLLPKIHQNLFPAVKSEIQIRKNLFPRNAKNRKSTKLNSRENFMPHGITRFLLSFIFSLFYQPIRFEKKLRLARARESASLGIDQKDHGLGTRMFKCLEGDKKASVGLKSQVKTCRYLPSLLDQKIRYSGTLGSISAALSSPVFVPSREE